MGQEHGEVQQAGGGQDVRRQLQQEPGKLYTGTVVHFYLDTPNIL